MSNEIDNKKMKLDAERIDLEKLKKEEGVIDLVRRWKV